MIVWHIFSGGEIQDNGFIKIESGDKVICADCGLRHAEKLGIVPNIVIGDFDSYNGELPEGAETLRSVPEKDDTDTLMAVKTAIERGAERIKIYGALGGRFDHTIANVQTLKFAQEHNCSAVLEDCDNIVMLQSEGTYRYQRREGWYFAFFAYSEHLYVKRLEGVKYPLKNAVIKNSFPIGVSNEFVSDNAVLDIGKGTALVICSKK